MFWCVGVLTLAGSIVADAWKVTTFLTLSAKPKPILSLRVRQARLTGLYPGVPFKCLFVFEFPLKPLRESSCEFESEGVDG